MEGDSTLRLTLVAFLLGCIPAFAEPGAYHVSARLQGDKLYVSVHTDEPARINSQAPISLTIKGSAITFKKTDYSRNDATATEHELLFEMSGTREGLRSPSVDGHLSFFLCTPTSCKRIEEAFRVQLAS